MNYYIKLNECKKCKRYDKIHLGKSSYGWQFSFQYNDGKYYKDIKEMKKWLKDKTICDEGGKEISYKDFWAMVKSKMNGACHCKECPDDLTSFNIEGYNFTNCEFS